MGGRFVRLRTLRDFRGAVESLAVLLGMNEPAGLDGMLECVEEAIRRLQSDEAEGHVALLRLSAALNELEEGSIVVDESGGEVFRNARGAQFVGARHGDAIVEEAIRELLALATGGNAVEREIQLFGPPRQVLRLRATPLEAAGAVAFISDVSHARHVEELRRDFVANVSHELRTPVGALELLAETIEGEPDVQVVRDLSARMGTEAHRLGRIVEDLLDLSAIEAEAESARAQASLGEMMRAATHLVRDAANDAGVDLRFVPLTDDITLWCDRGRMVSAFRNLLDNAVKYSEPPGAVEFGADIEDDRVVIRVSDQGIGIPARDLERVFERFYRVDRARSRATGGTGLGLSIVRHVAEVHGGLVRVESTEGEGSTFYLEFPLNDGVAEAMEESH